MTDEQEDLEPQNYVEEDEFQTQTFANQHEKDKILKEYTQIKDVTFEVTIYATKKFEAL